MINACGMDWRVCSIPFSVKGTDLEEIKITQAGSSRAKTRTRTLGGDTGNESSRGQLQRSEADPADCPFFVNLLLPHHPTSSSPATSHAPPALSPVHFQCSCSESAVIIPTRCWRITACGRIIRCGSSGRY